MKLLIAFVLAIFFLSSCSDEPNYEVDNWSTLIDPNFNQEKVVQFYKEKISHVKEGSKEEILIYAQLQEALKQAGNNQAIDGQSVKLSGYIVPVDTEEGKVNKFLFFPNQAACIHVPASPANQTIYVVTQKDEGVMMEDAYEQIVVYGTLQLKTQKIATGTASFVINNGITRLAPR